MFPGKSAQVVLMFKGCSWRKSRTEWNPLFFFFLLSYDVWAWCERLWFSPHLIFALGIILVSPVLFVCASHSWKTPQVTRKLMGLQYWTLRIVKGLIFRDGEIFFPSPGLICTLHLPACSWNARGMLERKSTFAANQTPWLLVNGCAGTRSFCLWTFPQGGKTFMPPCSSSGLKKARKRIHIYWNNAVKSRNKYSRLFWFPFCHRQSTADVVPKGF